MILFLMILYFLDDNTSATIIFFTITCGIILILIITTTAICMRYFEAKKIKTGILKDFELKNLETNNLENFDPECIINSQVDLLPYNRGFEFPREHLKLRKPLEPGSFGVIKEAIAIVTSADENESLVSVKMAMKDSNIDVLHFLVSELKIMIYLGEHRNLVNLLGAVTKNILKGEMMIITEHCEFGNLKSFLMNHQSYFVNQIRNDMFDQTIEIVRLNLFDVMEGFQEKLRDVYSSDLLSWAFQIARGMDYLSSNKVVHGDLAARNVLLCAGNIVKICGFGLSKSIYKNENYEKIRHPYKWWAVEAFTDENFSTLSDIWSYGKQIIKYYPTIG